MVPNLDCMQPDDLMTFWNDHQNRPRPIAAARILFPSKPKGYVSVTRDLGAYAANKATAIRCRLEGNIQSALVYEKICDMIYEGLPEWARW